MIHENLFYCSLNLNGKSGSDIELSAQSGPELAAVKIELVLEFHKIVFCSLIPFFTLEEVQAWFLKFKMKLI